MEGVFSQIRPFVIALKERSRSAMERSKGLGGVVYSNKRKYKGALLATMKNDQKGGSTPYTNKA